MSRSAEELPLTAKEQKFIRFYVRPGVRDVEKAAQMAGCSKRDGSTMYRRARVKADIDRRLAMVEYEQARLDAAQEVLSNNYLDKHLASIIEADVKELGAIKLAGIRLALVVKGRITTRDCEAVRTEASPQRPSIYGTILQAQNLPTPAAGAGSTTTTLRRTEEVIQMHGPTQRTAQGSSRGLAAGTSDAGMQGDISTSHDFEVIDLTPEETVKVVN